MAFVAGANSPMEFCTLDTALKSAVTFCTATVPRSLRMPFCFSDAPVDQAGTWAVVYQYSYTYGVLYLRHSSEVSSHLRTATKSKELVHVPCNSAAPVDQAGT